MKKKPGSCTRRVSVTLLWEQLPCSRHLETLTRRCCPLSVSGFLPSLRGSAAPLGLPRRAVEPQTDGAGVLGRTAPYGKQPRAAHPPHQWQPRRGIHCNSSRFALSAKQGGRGKFRQVLTAGRRGQKAPGPYSDLLCARLRPHAPTSGRVGAQHCLLLPVPVTGEG